MGAVNIPVVSVIETVPDQDVIIACAAGLEASSAAIIKGPPL